VRYFTYETLKKIKPKMVDSTFTLQDLEKLDRTMAFPIVLHFYEENTHRIGCEFIIGDRGIRRFCKIPVDAFNQLPDSSLFDEQKALTHDKS
jgi:hypothetical protein